MKNLSQIYEKIHESFEQRNHLRDAALTHARHLTRFSANAVRAVHRTDYQQARSLLDQAAQLVVTLKASLLEYPDLYYAGYTQDAIKEYVEASIVYALIREEQLPTPEELGVEYPAYVNGLAESIGELRRRCLDLLRHGYSQEIERLLSCMDDIYGGLITLDYPDAITNGLRRQTDVMRSVLERTRGDLTLSLRQHYMQQTIEKFLTRLPED